MLNNKYIKITAALSLFALAVGFTFSKLEVSNPVKAGLSATLLNTTAKVAGSEDTELDENTSRVYFSIFRFISNLVPASN